MGSGEMPIEDSSLHVFRDRYHYWWAVGCEGSFGGSLDRVEALKIARDASATAFNGERRIVVHQPNGRVSFTIRRVRQRPTSQLFQDVVP